MFSIEIQNPCGCAKKRKAWTKELVFETMLEAKSVADKMVEQGNERFCKRHKFEAFEEENKIIIKTSPNK